MIILPIFFGLFGGREKEAEHVERQPEDDYKFDNKREDTSHLVLKLEPGNHSIMDFGKKGKGT